MIHIYTYSLHYSIFTTTDIDLYMAKKCYDHYPFHLELSRNNPHPWFVLFLLMAMKPKFESLWPYTANLWAHSGLRRTWGPFWCRRLSTCISFNWKVNISSSIRLIVLQKSRVQDRITSFRNWIMFSFKHTGGESSYLSSWSLYRWWVQ